MKVCTLNICIITEIVTKFFFLKQIEFDKNK